MKTSLPLDFTHLFVQGVSHRTLLLLHGTGGDENDLLPIGRALDPEASLLSPRGKVLENGMPRFFRRLAEGIFDEKDLVLRTEELALFISSAVQKYSFDPRQVVAVGFSNGANIAGALLLLHPKTLPAAVLLRPMIPIIPDLLPDLRGVKVLVAAGKRDPIVPSSETEKLALLLQNAGAEVTTKFEDAGHGLSGESIAMAREWIEALPKPS